MDYGGPWPRGRFFGGYRILLIAWVLFTVLIGYKSLIVANTVGAQGTVVEVQPDDRPNRNPKVVFSFQLPGGTPDTGRSHWPASKAIAVGDSLELMVLPTWPHFSYAKASIERIREQRLTLFLIWVGVLLAAGFVRFMDVLTAGQPPRPESPADGVAQ